MSCGAEKRSCSKSFRAGVSPGRWQTWAFQPLCRKFISNCSRDLTLVISHQLSSPSRELQQQMIQPLILGHPGFAISMPGTFFGYGVQIDIVRIGRREQLTWDQYAHFAHILSPALPGYVGKFVIMSANKIIGPIGETKVTGLRFFAAHIRTTLGRNVMKHHPRPPGLPANRRTSIEPD